ncbi:VOC family protein [Frankia sp. CNm7]|uniref:VOC family protein n=1 Tax=Frankia nepalensis TaxID=1836974 RepID=A0A937R888_9ACTN|nr:VOC family protein [Frankia nepalensis]MBL7500001.1 VOC family protein [Frankia nepalensis]MBL7510653.1 VOC family protein [Frankia nepalensis]MBL7520766.1 VOC family protein [Frankia nepalensis]MBL7627186.1 VOC family protein [Frankia nepalensis]
MNEPGPLPLRATDLYHTCVVVENLAESMRQLTRLAGYRWMPAIEHPTAVWTPAGAATVPLRMVYSLDEPLLELIEQVPGTTWMPSPGGAIHHIGYFVDDLVASSRALTDAGLPLEACGAGATLPSGFAYHTTTAGLRIEVVNRSVLRDMRELLTASSAETPEAGA